MIRTVKKPTERRADIIRAARSLFQAQEYDKTTMQDVTESLGIAKGTIYHYFPTKEALLEAVVEDIVDRNTEQMKVVIEGATGNALEKIQALVETGNMAANNADILEHLHQPGNVALHIRLLATTLIKQAPFYETLIRQGCDEGIFKTDAPLECAEFILCGIQFLTDLGIYPWTQEDLNRRAHAFPALIEQQLKAPPESFEFIKNHIKKSI